jgi:bifunctional UDP-N-acetylglucosamine pyrophosphorylase/glucosamine-1-phosphate N-acetyltransferase
MKLAAIILAAGQGTRMHSKTPKVLHPLMGRPLLTYAIDAVKGTGAENPVVVVGHEAGTVRSVIGDQVLFALQAQQLGTGHAVLSAIPYVSVDAELILVTFADMPLLRTETLQKLVELHQSSGSVLTMSSIVGDVPRGFGRIVRDAAGNINAIVEEAVATPEQLAIREYNVSAYCFNAQWLWAALPRIKPSPKGEYYLTDLVEIAVKEGLTIRSLVLDDPTEGMGINNRVHLAEATAAMRFRINQELMLSGVTLVDPAMTYIEPGVQVGKDTVIWPNTYLHGNTVIGENCEIGPNTIIFDSKVGNQCKLFESTIEYAEIENNVSMGPFCHLRKGAHLADGVHMGNFGEVKDSYLGPGVKMGHFSYIGNARIEQNVNIGAGTITCNYDGVSKNLTEIGENAFIGSDTMLVAPVKIGKNAQTGAGSVVTKDVEDNTIVVGVPAHVIKRMEKSDRR